MKIVILIIDDDATLRSVMSQTLGPQGYEVLEAGTAAAGLALAIERRPDLVLCDFALEKGNGLEVLQGLRRQPSTATLPFILITGQNNTTLMCQGMDLGADDFLRKPFSDTQLLAAVQARLRQSESHKLLAEQTNSRLLSMLEATPDLAAVVEPDRLQIVYLNRAGRRLIDTPLGGDTYSLTLHELYPGRELPRILCEVLPQAIAQGHWTGDTLLRTRQAGELHVTQQFMAHKGPAGGVEYFTTLARDITTRRQAEHVLRLQATALNAAANGIVITDVKGRILMANQAFTTLTGYTAAEVKGLNPHVLKSGRHDAAFYRSMWQTILDGHVWHGELVNRRKDGSLYPEEMTITPVHDERGHISHFIAIKQDISERRLIEGRLRASEALHQSLVESLPLCLFRKDLEGRFTFANHRFCQTIQRSWEEIQGKTDLDLYPAEHATKYRADDRQVVETRESIRIVERNVTQDGTVRSVQVVKSPVFAADGRVAGLQGIFWDVTDQFRVEVALRESEERFRILGDAAPDAVILMDQTWAVKYWNRAAERMFGYTSGEADGQCLHRLIAPNEAQDAFRQRFEGFKNSGQDSAAGKTIELETVHRDGRRLAVELSIASVRIGGEWHAIGVIRDIEDRKQAEMQRASMEVQLRQAQKLESIGQLAAGIAHEINTPTQYIGDNVRFLQDAFADLAPLLKQVQALCQDLHPEDSAPPVPASLQEALRKADLDYLRAEIPKALQQSLEGVERVAKIVRAMKEFSHPGAQVKTLVDLNHAIETTATVARNEWKYVAKMVFDLDPALPPVPCLPGELNQVILNLIINAAHAIADVVGAEGLGLGTITIGTRRRNEEVEIRIQDTGTGIPEKVRGRIFDPFFTTKPVGKGTGQGLAIAHSVVVEKHGGMIGFETEMGKGTTFVIQLPLVSPKNLEKI